MRTTRVERFLAKVTIGDAGACWIWHGARTSNGYGLFRGETKLVVAHRWVYEHFIGPISDGAELDHTCFDRACVNPAHMEPVSKAENLRRRRDAGKKRGEQQQAKTHCPHGHAYDEANTIWYTNHRGNPGRKCRACKNIDMRRRRPTKPKPEPAVRCIHGHEMTGDNVYTRTNGLRECRTCITERQRARRARGLR